MATYTVGAGERGVHAKTAVANTADSVTFTARDCTQVEIVSDGAAALYVTVDGVTTATVAGVKTDVLPAGAVSRRVVNVSGKRGNATAVSLISAGTPTYSVTEVA